MMMEIRSKSTGKRARKLRRLAAGLLAAALLLAACGALAEPAAVTEEDRIRELEERLTESEAARAALEAEKRALLTSAGGAAQKLTALERELASVRQENEELLDQLTAAQAELANQALALQAQLDAFRRVESVSMPLGFTLPEDCGAAEVGGWLYVSRSDGSAQAVIRPFEGEDMTRDSLMEYLEGLLPQAPEASTVVRNFPFPGGELSRFAGSYTDEDGAEMYSVFCVAEIGGKFYCLETQAALENSADASSLANQLTATLRARD